MGYSNELYHYGVIGMKWGKHKSRYDERSQSHLQKKGGRCGK